MPPKRKAGALAILEEEVKNDGRQMSSATRSIMELLSAVKSQNMQNATPRQISEMRQVLKKHQERGINVGYLKTVLFPEQFSYEIPLPMSSISYAKFTDKQEMTISTGPKGEGMILWFPRATGGPTMFVFHSDDQAASTELRYQKPLPLNSGQGIAMTDYYMYNDLVTKANYNRAYWKTAFPQYCNHNFTQTALIGATISLQYVGKVEAESGLWVGGHVYGVGADKISIDDIENSQWVTRARPGEGLRFCFLPKDQTDFEFYPSTPGQAMAHGGSPFTGTDANLFKIKAIKDDTARPITTDAVKGPPYWLMANDARWTQKSDSKMPVEGDGLPMQIEYAKNTNYIAMYWTGMEYSKNWIRIDAIRKFAGIPTQETRDIVDLTRPSKSYDQNKTFQVLQMLCQNSPIGGHTLKEVDRVIDSLMEVLPNAGYYLENGGIEPVGSLGDLVEALQDPTGNDSKQLSGQLSGQTKRMYKYFL